MVSVTQKKGIAQTIEEKTRLVIPINENWEFKKIDSATSLLITKSTKNVSSIFFGDFERVNIPHTWNNQDMQMGKNFYQGNGFYKKIFHVPAAWKGKRIFLKFEGVGQVADLYVNNKFVGEHKGAYSAFVFEIGYGLLYDTINTIIVKANNETRPDIIPVNNFLFGIYGGIYRPVELIVTDKLNITTTDYASPGVYISQENVSAQSANIIVETKVDNKYDHGQNISLQTNIFNASGQLVQQTSTPYWVSTQGTQTFRQKLQIINPHLWQGLEDPYLYKVVVSIIQNGKTIDRVVQPLGLRKFELEKEKGMVLNDKPVRLKGVTRHQEWWNLGAALSNANHDTDLAIIKEMGANSIRFAHYQQAEYLYSRCDSIGFIIWAEIPFVNAYSGKESDNAKQQLTELVKQNYNHPSIYVWGLHNEVYNKTPEDYVSVLTSQLHDLAKTLDPYRYTVSTNGYGTMERPENNLANIQGMNRYYGWYEGKTEDLQKWVDGLQKKYPNHLVVLSEYGADGNLNQQAETLPKTINPVSGQFYPEQVQTLSHEIQWGILEKQNYLMGSYLWNTFDFAVPLWNRGGVQARNQKGLVTYDRKIKKDAFYWYKANWNPNPMIYITERRLTQRTNKTTNFTVYSNLDQTTLYVNGQKIKHYKMGTTKVHYVFENVVLKKGKNIIKATGISNNKQWEDSYECELIDVAEKIVKD
jgi:beta-galactosidase